MQQGEPGPEATPPSSPADPASDASRSTPELEILDLGRRSFEETYELQQQRLAARIRGEVPDALLLVEHDHVVTRGRRSQDGDVSGVPFPVVDLERGGEATYHGPGQLVAYVVVELPEGRRDLHRYLRDLEGVVIDALADFDVMGGRKDGFTGVWIGTKKVCSIGVAVRRWVTWHGLALNVHTDLTAFRGFAPCGLESGVMTRLVDHLEAPQRPSEAMTKAKQAVSRAFRARFTG